MGGTEIGGGSPTPEQRRLRREWWRQSQAYDRGVMAGSIRAIVGWGLTVILTTVAVWLWPSAWLGAVIVTVGLMLSHWLGYRRHLAEPGLSQADVAEVRQRVRRGWLWFGPLTFALAWAVGYFMFHLPI